MKKTIKLMMMALMAIVVCAGFAACSSDDDETVPGQKPADYSSVKTTPKVAVASGMLDIFDVTITANGKTETVTKDKVKETTIYAGITKIDALVYSMEETTVKTPATVTVTAEAKLKEGIDLTKLEKSDYLLTPILAYQFGSNDMNPGVPTSVVQFKGLNWSTWTDNPKYTKKSCTGTFNADGSGSIK